MVVEVRLAEGRRTLPLAVMDMYEEAEINDFWLATLVPTASERTERSSNSGMGALAICTDETARFNKEVQESA